MKLYLMYLKMKNLEPYLYAYTDNKDYYKKFKKERNKDVFIIIEKNVSKTDYYNFANKHRNQNLKKCLFETYIETETDYKRDIVDIICTYNEESSVIMNYEYINKEISKSTNTIAMKFNDELIEALNNLYYFDFLKQKVYSKEYTECLTFNETYFDGFSESPFGYNYDYLAIFIKMYGYTLNENIR